MVGAVIPGQRSRIVTDHRVVEGLALDDDDDDSIRVLVEGSPRRIERVSRGSVIDLVNLDKAGPHDSTGRPPRPGRPRSSTGVRAPSAAPTGRSLESLPISPPREPRCSARMLSKHLRLTLSLGTPLEGRFFFADEHAVWIEYPELVRASDGSTRVRWCTRGTPWCRVLAVDLVGRPAAR